VPRGDAVDLVLDRAGVGVDEDAQFAHPNGASPPRCD
jgi:hypothetical protein